LLKVKGLGKKYFPILFVFLAVCGVTSTGAYFKWHGLIDQPFAAAMAVLDCGRKSDRRIATAPWRGIHLR